MAEQMQDLSTDNRQLTRHLKEHGYLAFSDEGGWITMDNRDQYVVLDAHGDLVLRHKNPKVAVRQLKEMEARKEIFKLMG